VIADGFGLVIGFTGFFDTAARDYTLQITVTHTHTHTHTPVSTVMHSLPMLGSGFQRRAFPKCSPPQPPVSNSNSSRLKNQLSSDQPTQESKSKLYYNRQSVGQSVLVSGTHLGPALSDERMDLSFTVKNRLSHYTPGIGLTECP
jgi:hypothetical protein